MTALITPRASPIASAPLGASLEENPKYIGNLVFIQAGVMSRTNIIAYQELADQIERLLDDVNGGSVPTTGSR